MAIFLQISVGAAKELSCSSKVTDTTLTRPAPSYAHAT
jgi:hypothetical protein